MIPSSRRRNGPIAPVSEFRGSVRSNVGVYNGNDVTQMITFTLYDPAGAQLGQVSASAPPRTSVQVSNVFAAAGLTRDVPDAYCVVHGDQDLPLIAYAGVIDNQSQDLAFIKGESASPPEASPRASRRPVTA